MRIDRGCVYRKVFAARAWSRTVSGAKRVIVALRVAGSFTGRVCDRPQTAKPNSLFPAETNQQGSAPQVLNCTWWSRFRRLLIFFFMAAF
jgi:hypothetical protein